MALTPAEKQKRYRGRKKEKEKSAVEVTTDFLKSPFHEFLNAHSEWSGVEANLDFVGIAAPTFEADEDPQWEEHHKPYGVPYRGAIGRAERMVSCLLDAAADLARIINDYKRKEISARISEIEQSDLSDPDTRKKALADIVQLKSLEGQLNKLTRHGIYQWEVKGE